MRYDVIVAGAGPAGLSAAITLKIRNKSVLVIGNTEISEKVIRAEKISNYPGLPEVSGSELGSRLREHALNLNAEIIKKHIVAVYGMGEYFSIQTSDGSYYESKTVIISTGADFGKPYPGEMKFLGRAVSYCATCDAPLYREKQVVIIGADKQEETEAVFMAELASHVVYIPLYGGNINLPDTVEVRRCIPVRFEGDTRAEKLIIKENGSETENCICADGFFILRQSVTPSQLVPGINIEADHIAVNRNMETNIPGCFACGDITGAPYQYIKAAGEGNVAAISAVKYLADKAKG